MKKNFQKIVMLFITAFFLTGALFAQTVYITTTAGNSTFTTGGGAVVIDAGVTVTNGPHTGAIVSIVANFIAAQDQLNFTNQLSITGNYNAGTGVLTLTGAGVSADNWTTALRSVTYQNNAAVPNTATRTIAIQVGTSLAWSGNDHYYKYVSSPEINWDEAQTAAALDANKYYGLRGYLATLTSAGEQSFINAKISGQAWLGGSDNASEGTWKWVTGPENNTTFSLGSSPFGGAYTNWAPGEPNNAGNENYLHLYITGMWNDYAIDNSAIFGYLVEYGGLGGDVNHVIEGNQSVAVVQVPPAPTLNAATLPTNLGFTANWNASNGATGYYLDVSKNPWTSYEIGNGGTSFNVGNVTTYAVTGLSSSATVYTWRLRAYNAQGLSAHSGEGTMLTKPNPPTFTGALPLPATSITTTSFAANWNASTGTITGYKLDVSTATGAGFDAGILPAYNNFVIAAPGVTTPVTGLTAGTNYYWRLRAYNASGDSPDY